MAATRRPGGGLRRALVAACAALGVSGTVAQAVEVDGAVLGYTEPNRVSAFEAATNITHTFDNGRILGMHLVFDALTGASANGATPASTLQTFTRPSGYGSFVTEAGQTPLDDTFRDTRVALSGSHGMNLDASTKWTVGLYGSTEHDYTSLGANTSLEREFDRQNTTVTVRAGYFDDTINPEGGRPEPLAPMAPARSVQPRLAGDGSKTTLDLGLGLTQVIDRKTLFHVAYTRSQVDGYQTDPYKLLSEVDPVTGDPDRYLFEQRPDARTKHIVYSRLVRALGRNDLRLSYRYMNDDWNITSHTVEVHYRLNLSGGQYLEPHGRYYTQTAAEFYRRFLVSGEALPEFASADYRLGDMKGYTGGVTYGRPMGEGRELTVRFEYYAQTGDGRPAEAFGVLRDYDLFPTVDAFIVQVGYSLDL
ncbi:MAG: DUF3570 domain-containing protein [Candidatus Krumholzibacteriia bacterium]